MKSGCYLPDISGLWIIITRGCRHGYIDNNMAVFFWSKKVYKVESVLNQQSERN
jgi:hypothetical protein